MRQFQTVILLLSLLFGGMSSHGQYALPPEALTSIKTTLDTDVAKDIEMGSTIYTGSFKTAEKEGFKFQLKGKGLRTATSKPVYVWYIFPGNELRYASEFQLPNLKKDTEFTVDFTIQDLNKLTTPLPDNYIRITPEKFDGFALTYEIPSADLVDKDATGKNIKAGPNEETFTIVEVMPAFPGGIKGIMTYLSKSIKYPEEAQQKDIQGRVNVTFTIDEEGKVTNPKVLERVDESLDAEALRVTNGMPNWLPGRLNGMPVKSNFTLPITFKLQGDKKMKKENKKADERSKKG